MSAPLDQLMQAKAARDVVRSQLVKAIRKLGAPLGDEIEGLLKADDVAAQGLATAQAAYDQISDFTS